VIVISWDTGPNDAATELARGADLLVSEANSVEDSKQGMISSGVWQALSRNERVRIMRQATEGHNVTGRNRRLHVLGRRGAETFFWPGACRKRPYGVLKLVRCVSAWGGQKAIWRQVRLRSAIPPETDTDHGAPNDC
jgi:hypothetical protein